MADKRAVTSKGMDKTLKKLGLTIQDLIDAEEKMRPNSPRWYINKKKIEDLKRQRSLMIAQANKK
tara:strand:- start:35 stop:229 length:195 start_codon:yes stop_codon:yes gene_type:complete